MKDKEEILKQLLEDDEFNVMLERYTADYTPIAKDRMIDGVMQKISQKLDLAYQQGKADRAKEIALYTRDMCSQIANCYIECEGQGGYKGGYQDGLIYACSVTGFFNDLKSPADLKQELNKAKE